MTLDEAKRILEVLKCPVCGSERVQTTPENPYFLCLNSDSKLIPTSHVKAARAIVIETLPKATRNKKGEICIEGQTGSWGHLCAWRPVSPVAACKENEIVAVAFDSLGRTLVRKYRRRVKKTQRRKLPKEATQAGEGE